MQLKPNDANKAAFGSYAEEDAAVVKNVSGFQIAGLEQLKGGRSVVDVVQLDDMIR